MSYFMIVDNNIIVFFSYSYYHTKQQLIKKNPINVNQ